MNQVSFRIHIKRFLDSTKRFRSENFILVTGKLLWYDWENCSKSCGSGVRVKIAQACIPTYAICHHLNILRESCNTHDCPEDIPIGVPPGENRVGKMLIITLYF